MKLGFWRRFALGTLTLGAVCAGSHVCTAAELIPQRISGFDQSLVAAGMNFSRYSQLLVTEPEVAFERQWLRDHRQDISPADQQKLASNYGAELQKRLAKQLGDRFALVSQADAKTLIIQPRLSNLVLNGPDLSTGVLRDVYVQNVGRVVIELAIRDGATGELLARLTDAAETQSAPDNRLIKANRVQNLVDFRRLMDSWGRSIKRFVAPESA